MEIFSGRGNYNSPGNKRMREMSAPHVKSYIQKNKQADKTAIINNLLAKIVDEGLIFLDKDRVNMSTAQARKKVAHVLRDMVREKRRLSKASQRLHRRAQKARCQEQQSPDKFQPNPPKASRRSHQGAKKTSCLVQDQRSRDIAPEQDSRVFDLLLLTNHPILPHHREAQPCSSQDETLSTSDGQFDPLFELSDVLFDQLSASFTEN